MKEGKGNGQKLLLGLIGAGIQQSRTPVMHELEAAAHGILCLYQLIDLHVLRKTNDALRELLAAAELMGFSGLNVTHPCKQAIIPHLTDLSDDARELGAVNTVVLREGKRIGHNTDWSAFYTSFQQAITGVRLRHVVQVGAGGAGAATAYAILKLGAERVTIIDTDAERAASLAARYSALFKDASVTASQNLAASISTADGIIHATPMGMDACPGMAVPKELLRSDLWVAEVVYFPLETELLRAARAAGCRTVDGSGMAVYQAVQAFRLFSGLEADAARMRQYFGA